MGKYRAIIASYVGVLVYAAVPFIAAGSVDDATFSRLLEEVATERQTAIDVLRAQH